ncbi:MAG: type II toxin-antitoxin system HicA family toxin [Candidatus Heimdallarchaeota archaeon]
MKKLPTISATKLIRKLLKAGFQDAPKKGKGSHRALIRIDDERKPNLVIIPLKDSIPKGTLLSIIKQSGLTREEFIKLLK